MTQTILLAGATGMLGGRIAHHLLGRPDVRLRLLVRPGAAEDPRKGRALRDLRAGGAELVEGDLADPASLGRAAEGANVVVSAVQGDRRVMVDGQAALARAARAGGARRMLPSDFALDLFVTPPGEHRGYDDRREAAQAIAAEGLAQTHLLNGAFADLFASPRSPMFDVEAGEARFWGEGHEAFEVTSVEDTARMAARVAADPEAPDGKFAFAGDRISPRGIAAALGEVTGRPLRLVSLGDEAGLRAAIAQASARDPWAALILTYQLYMMTDEAALTDLQNGRYPDLRLDDFPAVARKALG